jgi:hypothetical protein
MASSLAGTLRQRSTPMGGRMPVEGESLNFMPVWAEHRVARPLGVDWIHGSVSAKHNTDPNIQVHWYDEHT